MPPDLSPTKLGSAAAWRVWIIAVVFVAYQFSIQTGYAIVNGVVQADINLNVTQIGTIAATYTWVFALCQFYSGALLDRLGARIITPASIALVTLGAFTYSKANSFEMLLLAQTILAIGSCSAFVGAGYLGGQWFGMAKFSFMFGLVLLFAALTSAISQNTINYLLETLQWRELFSYAGFVGVALFALAVTFIRNPQPIPKQAQTGVLKFFSSVTTGLFDVAKIGHVWLASLVGAALFGTLLASGVVWAPKLLVVRGASEATAVIGSSMLWLGLAVGSAILPWWSDRIQRRKPPIVLCTLIQFAALVVIIYLPPLGSTIDLALCFIFGVANAAHMLCFSSAADVVKPNQIGTSASIVNGMIFITGGIMMARPGIRIDRAIEMGAAKVPLDIAQYAALPFVVVLASALVLALAMKETYPVKQAASE